MSYRPILSIIIPTKNRAHYVGPNIRSLLKCPAPDLEVVVQDNSDNQLTEEAVAPCTGDPRLRYRRCTDHLSMSDNFTKGLEGATGEYLAFLGDDDGVNPELVSAVRWAKTQELDALVGCTSTSYNWPDMTFTLYGKLLSGTLFIGPFSGAITYPDPETEINFCARTAGYSFNLLPKAYQGTVRRDCLEQVFQKTGTYFPGPTPDLASAVALASIVKRYAYIDYPLIFAGVGKGSGGGAGAEKKHDWSLESVPWFSRRAIDLWSDLVPRFCCGSTLWAEDVVQALRAVGRDDVLQHFNAVYLYARCAVFSPHHNPQTFSTYRRFLKSRNLSRIRGDTAFTYYYLWIWLQRLSAFVSNTGTLSGLSKTRRIPSVADIDQAVDVLTQFLRSQGRHFDERLT